jgi:hypothetical protein
MSVYSLTSNLMNLNGLPVLVPSNREQEFYADEKYFLVSQTPVSFNLMLGDLDIKAVNFPDLTTDYLNYDLGQLPVGLVFSDDINIVSFGQVVLNVDIMNPAFSPLTLYGIGAVKIKVEAKISGVAGAATEVSILNGGSGYAIDDEITTVQESEGLTLTVASVDGEGGVTGLNIVDGGSNITEDHQFDTNTDGDGMGLIIQVDTMSSATIYIRNLAFCYDKKNGSFGSLL